MYANNFYAKEVEEAVKRISDQGLAQKARKAASMPSFYWLCVHTIKHCVGV
jgi:hypothetical protein